MKKPIILTDIIKIAVVAVVAVLILVRVVKFAVSTSVSVGTDDSETAVETMIETGSETTEESEESEESEEPEDIFLEAPYVSDFTCAYYNADGKKIKYQSTVFEPSDVVRVKAGFTLLPDAYAVGKSKFTVKFILSADFDGKIVAANTSVANDFTATFATEDRNPKKCEIEMRININYCTGNFKIAYAYDGEDYTEACELPLNNGKTLLYTYDEATTGYIVSRDPDNDWWIESVAEARIPDSYDGKPITAIAENLFNNCGSLTSVTIPDSVTSIGEYAFYNCSSLTSVTIPDGVTSIGECAFYNCSSLTSMTIPDGVTSIGQYTFYNCKKLTNITVGNGVTSVGEHAFYGCIGLASVNYLGTAEQWAEIGLDSDFSSPLYYAKKLYINNEPVTEVNLTTATKISAYAFRNCSDLKSVTIPDSITSIGEDAFEDCSGLTSVNYLGTIDQWVEISFGNAYSNPIYYAKKLYINDEPVTEANLTTATKISAFAFYNCSDLKSVKMPDSVIGIGKSAFYNCSSLTSMTIPDGVTSIGGYAFCDCSGLSSITIPDSVTSIGSNAFQDTAWYDKQSDGLVYAGKVAYTYKGTMQQNTAIVIKDGTISITAGAFYNCSGLTSITIPESVTSIGGSAFYGCTGLTSVTIPDSVTSIGNSAFYNCSGLTSITIPDSVTLIGDYAFEYCSGLTSITIGNSVTSIGSLAFYNCSKLTDIRISDISAWCNISGLSDLMRYGSSNKNLYLKDSLITDLVIPDGVTSIGGAAFCNCTGLTSVTIPDSVTSIGEYAFFYCDGLTSVTIPESVTSIGGFSFYNCSGLANVTIGNGLTSIGGFSFYNCSGLTSVNYLGTIDQWVEISFSSDFSNPLSCAKKLYINNELVTEANLTTATKISAYAFYDYSELTSVKIGNSVTSIGGSAFYNCSRLTSITIPDSVTSIGSSAFSGCSGLTSVTIGDSVKSIGVYAFRNCSGLTSVIWNAKNCTSAGSFLYHIFENCSNLSNVTIGENVKTIPAYAFEDCSGLTTVTIPNSVTNIGRRAFRSCSGLTSITIPNSIINIGDDAFMGCYGLEKITVAANNKKYCSKGNCLIDKTTQTLIKGCKNSVIPNDGSVTSIGDLAFYNCSGLTSITIPDSVINIGYGAFSWCSKLTTINYGGSINEWLKISSNCGEQSDDGSVTVKCSDGEIRIKIRK